jgi:hypothetical protein
VSPHSLLWHTVCSINRFFIHKAVRVEPPITENFPLLSSVLKQIEQFLCHWTCKLKDYKCSLSVRSK